MNSLHENWDLYLAVRTILGEVIDIVHWLTSNDLTSHIYSITWQRVDWIVACVEYSDVLF